MRRRCAALALLLCAAIAPKPGASQTEPDEALAAVSFPPGVTSVQLPVDYDHAIAKFIVHVAMGGHSYGFLLDTGASGIFMERHIAKDLDLKPIATYKNDANAGTFESSEVVAPLLSIGSLTMRDVKIDTIPDGNMEGTSEAFPAVGALGYDFIRAVVLKLDYEKGAVFAYSPINYVFPDGPHLIDLDIRLEHGQATTSVIVNGETGEHFVLDTGGAGAMLVTDFFRRQHPGAVVDEMGSGTFETLEGIGGDFSARHVRIAKLTIGNATFTTFDAYVVDEARIYSGHDFDGVLGPHLFRLYTVYLDYYTGEARMIPNSAGMTGIIPTRH